MTKIITNIGDRFGLWEVLEVLPNAESLCLCHGCLKTTRAIKNYRLKNTKSCGCTKNKYGKPIEVGDTFQFWLVKSLTAKKSQYVTCECLGCGAIKEVRKSDLRTKRSSSCGCQAVLNRSKTNKEKYGVDFYTQATDFQEKSKNTCLEKYNTPFSSQDPTIKAKKDATCLEKYGTIRPSTHPDVVEKRNKTNLQRYGSRNTIHLVHQNQTRLFLSTGESLLDFCKKYGKNKEHAYKIFHNYGEQAFRDYCSEEDRGTSIELFFQKLIRPLIPDLQKYDKKPAELQINRRPDFLLEKNNKKLYVNIDGLYMHSELKKESKKYHYDLTVEFNKVGLRLMQFREDELRQTPQIIYSMIENYFNQSPNSYNARSCSIKKLSKAESSEFIFENHLMGVGSAHRSYGLFHDNNLIACMSIRKKKGILEIARFCTLLRSSVRGGFSKLLSHVIKEEGPQQIVSFCDLRYASGISYKRVGFQQESISLGWRWTDGKQTFNRLQCKANMDDRKLSQAEYAKEKGWYKIYDAGQIKYNLKLEED